jgi:hypothetical protein
VATANGGAGAPAIRLLAQEYLTTLRPGARLDDLSWDEAAELLSDGFLAWRDAHPNRELVERQMREQEQDEREMLAEMYEGLMSNFLKNPKARSLTICWDDGDAIVMRRD